MLSADNVTERLVAKIDTASPLENWLRAGGMFRTHAIAQRVTAAQRPTVAPARSTVIASPRKLSSGEWGVAVPAGTPVGAIVLVRTNTGKEWKAQIGRIVWTGNGISLATSQSLDAPPPPRARSTGYGGGYSRRRECKTGGNCSSFGSGRSCGGHDCDGY